MIIPQLIATVLTFSLVFNQAQKDFYIQSWKKGKRTIQEQKLTISLNAKQPEYRAKIKDSSGKERYELSVTPIARREKEPGLEWYVDFKPKTGLFDHLLDDDRVNLLKPSNDPYQDSFGEEDFIWVFSPRHESPLVLHGDRPDEPRLTLLTKRIVKVESFYVLMYVKSYTPNPKDPGALDSMELCIEFTNRYTGASP